MHGPTGAEPRTHLPVGTIVFLRSDIEGSMEHVRALGPRYDLLNAEHAQIVRSAIAAHGGDVVRTEGDAFFAVFSDAPAAARAAVDIQRGMTGHGWPAGHDFRVRTGLHAGSAQRAGDDYGGFEVNRAARIAALGCGGQIVLSDAARALIGQDGAAEWSVRELGRYRLKGVIELEPLFQLDAPGLTHEFPPIRGESTGSEHLPRRLTTFIGREDDLTSLGRLLEETRLLTLTGPGGTGKTTLALELARRHAGGYVDGAWLVDLQAVEDPEEVKAEIAHGIGLNDGSTGPAEQRLLGYVADRELLIVIDNFEQVLAGADVLPELLSASPGTSVIVTSRVPLRLSMEQEYGVKPLSTSAPQDAELPEAVRLFVDRARRVRPDIELGEADTDAARSICQALDGLPLAIELCAARVSALPPTVIHERLLARLPLPDAAPRDLPSRQRTIDATVAWSFDLLDQPSQRLFVRLGIFEGTFDLEQAEEICGPSDELGCDVLSGLFTLVEHSLLYRVDGGGIRFGMLEAMRAFVSARLEASGERPLLARRHAECYVALGERFGGRVHGDEPSPPIDRLEPDGPNLLAAARFAVTSGDVELSFRAVGALWRFWLWSGRLADCQALTDAALRLPGASDPRVERIGALDAAGAVTYWTKGPAAADQTYEEQLALARQLGDRAREALAWSNVAMSRGFPGDFTSAHEALDRAERLYDQLGDARGLDLVTEFRTAMRLIPALREPGEAHDELAAIRREFLEAPQLRLRKLGLAAHAWISLLDGDVGAAARAVAQAMRIDLAVRETTTAIADMALTPWVLSKMERREEAVTVYAAVEAALERLGIRVPFGEDEIARAAIGLELEQEAYPDAQRRGRNMSLEELTDYVEALG